MALRRIERWLKDLGFRWIGQSAPRPFSRPTSTDLKRIRNILVIRLDDRIGNAILITPLLICLKHTFSDARLSCLLSRRLLGLAEFIPAVDEFLWYAKRAYARNPFRLWRLVHLLQRERFDLVIDASDERELSFNHAVTTAYSGGRFRVGYDRRGSARWLEVPVRPGDPTRHAVEMHLDLLRAIAPVEFAPRPTIKSVRSDAFGRDFRRRHGLAPAEPMVVIHPGGRGPKRWPAHRFVELAREIADRVEARPVVVWGPAEADFMGRAFAQADPRVVWAGILPLSELISLLASAAAYVSNDNGIMHLASACGVPTVGVFVVSHADKYCPLGPRDRVFDESGGPVANEVIVEALRGLVEQTVADTTIALPARERESQSRDWRSPQEDLFERC